MSYRVIEQIIEERKGVLGKEKTTLIFGSLDTERPLDCLDSLSPRLLVLQSLINLCGPEAMIEIDNLYKLDPAERMLACAQASTPSRYTNEADEMDINYLKEKSSFDKWFKDEMEVRMKLRKGN